MAPNSGTLAWKIPWAEEPGGLQSMGSHRVGHDGSDLAAAVAVYSVVMWSPTCPSHWSTSRVETEFYSHVFYQTCTTVSFILCVCSVAQSRLIPCNCMDCSPPGSSVHGILQGRILEWVAIAFFRGIFLTQGLNLCLLHWQGNSLQLSHHGSP